jgi:hypothetical protein
MSPSREQISVAFKVAVWRHMHRVLNSYLTQNEGVDAMEREFFAVLDAAPKPAYEPDSLADSYDEGFK